MCYINILIVFMLILCSGCDKQYNSSVDFSTAIKTIDPNALADYKVNVSQLEKMYNKYYFPYGYTERDRDTVKKVYSKLLWNNQTPENIRKLAIVADLADSKTANEGVFNEEIILLCFEGLVECPNEDSNQVLASLSELLNLDAGLSLHYNYAVWRKGEPCISLLKSKELQDRIRKAGDMQF